jgi:hypothetical protein
MLEAKCFGADTFLLICKSNDGLAHIVSFMILLYMLVLFRFVYVWNKFLMVLTLNVGYAISFCCRFTNCWFALKIVHSQIMYTPVIWTKVAFGHFVYLWIILLFSFCYLLSECIYRGFVCNISNCGFAITYYSFANNVHPSNLNKGCIWAFCVLVNNSICPFWLYNICIYYLWVCCKIFLYPPASSFQL